MAEEKTYNRPIKKHASCTSVLSKIRVNVHIASQKASEYRLLINVEHGVQFPFLPFRATSPTPAC